MKKTRPFGLMLICVCSLIALAPMPAPVARWSEAKANAWYAKQPWLVGSNYIPATAINELEMWQAETFDPKTIEKELAWAESLGMTTMRVFLHDLAWQQDAAGYRDRIDRFLQIAARHRIKPLLVLFDSCWDPYPKLGRQRDPKPGVHNSGWLQSPGAEALQDPKEHPRLKAYVTGVVKAFAKDPRVLGWDIWNEPDNTNTNSYGSAEPKNKVALVLALLPQVFEWAREAGAQQPLTSGVWKGDWSTDDKLSPTERVQLESSDVISFHNNADQMAPAIPSPDPVHGVHGTWQRQHVPGLAAGRPEVQGGGHQLGVRRRKDADLPALGLVAEPLRQSGTHGMVPRDLQAGRHAVQAGRSGPDSQVDGCTRSLRGRCWAPGPSLRRAFSLTDSVRHVMCAPFAAV
jgi:hypothetical protein